MTSTKRATTKGTAAYIRNSSTQVCLVTGWSRLAESIRKHLGENQVKVEHRLADLIAEKDCQLFIVDTKVLDINIWPAPLLLEPSTKAKSWLFLLEKPNDASFLRPPPLDCAFFERRIGALDRLASYVSKRLDPNSRTRIENVEYIHEIRTFIVRMENGRAYALRIDELPESDLSDVIRWTISKDRHFFKVTQRSGNAVEVPWDDVLYHCEPDYEYYKGKQSDQNDCNRATRIGNRVRELRTERGLSSSVLAERAGMKRPNLSRLEYGRHIPSLETLERIADALGVTVAQLIAVSDRR